jgi:hypothetical protein
MVSRGRPRNPLRAAAREAGEKFYAEQDPCDFCGTNKRYVSNAGCVACAISRGNARYAALDETAKAVVKARDHERYVNRMAETPDDG